MKLNLKLDFKRINKWYLSIFILHFLFTFYTDRIMFDFSKLNVVNYIFCKIITLVALGSFWHFIRVIFVDKNAFAKKMFKNLIIYLVPMCILLIFIWPGIWLGSDNKTFFELATTANFHYKLNYLSSVFYIVSYMIFPLPTGSVIMQTILIGSVAAYILTKTLELNNNKKICYLMYLPFFFLHTIFYIFYVNRPIIVGTLYLLLVAIMLFDKVNKNTLDNKKLAILTILVSLLTSWRKEQFYLVIAIPIVIFIAYNLKLNKKNLIKVLLPIFLASLIVYIPQQIAFRDKMTNINKNMPTYITPLSCMLNMDLKKDNLEEDLKKIDKVVDVEICKQYYSHSDCAPMYHEGWLRDFTLEDYDEFLEGYSSIIKNNIDKFLKAKYLTFIEATSIDGDLFSSIGLYSSNEDTLYSTGYRSSKVIFDYNLRINFFPFEINTWNLLARFTCFKICCLFKSKHSC